MRGDPTFAVINASPHEDTRFGIMSVDPDMRIMDFAEKPEQSDSTLASTGLYVFNREFLLRRLEEDARVRTSSHDFGRNIIPKTVDQDRVFAHPFNGHWVDVGTIPAYWVTNLALRDWNPGLVLYDSRWVIHTPSEERPPAKFSPAVEAHNCLGPDGCIITGTVINSVLSPGVQMGRGAVMRD